MRLCGMQMPVKPNQRFHGRLDILEHCVQNLRRALSQVLCLLQRTRGGCIINPPQSSRLPLAQYFALFCKTQKIFVGIQQLFGAGVAKPPVERVD